MSVNAVDRVSPYPGAPFRDDGPAARRRDAGSEPARQRARAAPESLAPGAGRPLPPEIAFLAAHGAPLVLLQYGAALARRQGAGADAVLIAEGLVSEDRFYRALAAELNVPYLDALAALEPSAALEADAVRGHARLARRPDGLRWLFAPRGEDIARLVGVTRSSAGRPLFALTTPSLFEDALRRSSSRRLARAAAYSVERAEPGLGARPALGHGAILAFFGANLALLAVLAFPVPPISRAAATLLALLFLANALLRLYACARSGPRADAAPALDDADLPVYSVVVAAYDEAAMAEQMVAAIDALDYPRAKLDVKFVVEHDDVATARALRAARRRPGWEIVAAPPGEPRTKPRALNVALPFLRGSLVGVFDAEDIPEPAQLRKAAALFARSDQRLACLQASLDIMDDRRHWSTAMFRIDYCSLFDVFDRGASAAGLPFFLGGSSNHFRVAALRAVGGWDAFNVTEDADLGLRLARRGYRVKTFASRTLEQAPREFSALVAQRSRWMKGWMQTALVHCRDPRGFFADLGVLRASAAIAIFVGGVAAPFHGPVFMWLLARDAAFGALLAPQTTVDALWSGLCGAVAGLGFAAEAAPRLVAMRRARLWRLWPALLRWPLWSLMLTLAAWRAARDLWLRPFYWDKTDHAPVAAPSGGAP